MKKLIFFFMLNIVVNLNYAQVQDTWPQLQIIMETLDTQHGVGLGSGVFGIGDINQDGFDDVMAGYKGKTAIYYGRSQFPLDPQPDLWLSKGGPTAYGDVNGDGYDDFILVKHSNIPFQDSVFIYFGGAPFDTIPDLVIPADTTIMRSEAFGQAINIGGDLNHDGQKDIIITDYAADTYAVVTGKVYIYLGGDSLDNQVDFTITGDSALMQLGWDVATGDLNRDGWDDLVISGFYPGAGTGDSSHFNYIDIYMGKPDQDFTQRDYRIRKEFYPSHLSLGVHLTVFDYNADGYDDIITGNGYVFLGSADFDTTADFFIDYPVAQRWYNVSANVGDINGDGYDDLGFGSPGHALNSGYALFYLGGPNMNTGPDPDAGRAPVIGGSVFGTYLNSAGDVNSDGINDVIISAPGYYGSGFLICSGDTTLQPMTIIGEPATLPETFQIKAYPNPFNASVTIRLTLPNAAVVKVDIYNILGQHVQTLLRQRYPAGSHSVIWQPEESNQSGLYFARVAANQRSKIIKLLLIK